MKPHLTIIRGCLVLTAAACGGGTNGAPPAQDSPAQDSPVLSDATTDQAALADSVRRTYTQADIDFMAGMIHHHAQALVMSRMAPSHGASPSMRILTERIINAQNDEIALMQDWLADRDLPVPGVTTSGKSMGVHDEDGMGMMGMMGMMPGMLTDDQLARLDAARGPEFDRLFLTFMIQHHQGALTMVEELFGTYGAAQEQAVFKLASDIGADQSSEITRMQSMLREMLFGSGTGP